MIKAPFEIGDYVHVKGEVYRIEDRYSGFMRYADEDIDFSLSNPITNVESTQKTKYIKRLTKAQLFVVKLIYD